MVVDHDTVLSVDAMPISEFKATCLAVLKRVQRTRRSVLVTRRGEPVAVVQPPPPPEAPARSPFGAMAGTAKELRDIVEPLPEKDWEALR